MTKLKIKWQRVVASDDIRRSSHSIAITPDKHLKIFGGEVKPGELADQKVHSVDLTAKSATVSASFEGQAPGPRAASEAITFKGAMILFSGGRGGTDADPINEHGHLWALKDGVWTLVLAAGSHGKAPPGPRAQHCLASDGADVLFLHGGCAASGRLDDLWAFVFSGDRWVCLRPAPGRPRSGASIAWVKGARSLFRFGGRDGEGLVGGGLDVFDAGRKRWTSEWFTPDGEAGPEARENGCLLHLRGMDRSWVIAMFGEGHQSSLGHQGGSGRKLGDAWAWAVSEKRWQKVEFEGEEVPEARACFGAQSVGDEFIVLHGGLGDDNETLGDVWIGLFVVTQ